jgi:hypothetical protein
MENQETFEIRVEESVHYCLRVKAKSLKEAKTIAKDIKDGHLFITDYSGGDTPVHFGKIKAKVVTSHKTAPKDLTEAQKLELAEEIERNRPSRKDADQKYLDDIANGK